MIMMETPNEFKGISLTDYFSHWTKDGHRLVRGPSGTTWLRYESFSMMEFPAFSQAPVRRADLLHALWRGPALAVTHLLEPDASHPANACLYLCCDKSYRIEKLTSVGRRDARRANRSLRMAFVDWPTILSEGFTAYSDTRRRVGLSDGTHEHFRRRFTLFSTNPGHVAVGAWKDRTLVAFMTLVIVEDWVEITGTFSTDAHRGLCPNDGLASFVLKHFLAERGFRKVSYGLSSIQEAEVENSLHTFKKKAGFEAEPVHRVFVVHPLLWPLASGVGAHGIRMLRRLFPGSRHIRKACGLIEFLSAGGARQQVEWPAHSLLRQATQLWRQLRWSGLGKRTPMGF